MAITGIESVVFGAPDLALARRLFTDWGLAARTGRAREMAFEAACGSRIVVCAENAPELPPRLSAGSHFRQLVWGVSSRGHLEQIAEELARDRKVEEERAGAFRAVDDCGISVAFRLWVPRARKPQRAAAFNSPARRVRVDSVAKFYRRARPWRMGHIAFFVPEVRSAERFYVKRLGFWVSDRYAGGAATFLRCAARSDHHNLFFLKSRSGTTDLHHIAFEVSDVHEVFGGGLHFSRRGWTTAVGPGRHPISSAYFWYFRNPLGGMIEYFCDPDFVTPKWRPHNYRLNRFSEWHLADGIRQPADDHARPSLATARTGT
jgi:catechol 2,3-dioxygenase-like lactoylglutathione lyase family enzyme